MNYAGFNIESFEAGTNLWHARIMRADSQPVEIDGVSFSTLEVGFAWSNREAAVEHAKTRIDHLNRRQTSSATAPQAGQPRPHPSPAGVY